MVTILVRTEILSLGVVAWVWWRGWASRVPKPWCGVVRLNRVSEVRDQFAFQQVVPTDLLAVDGKRWQGCSKKRPPQNTTRWGTGHEETAAQGRPCVWFVFRLMDFKLSFDLQILQAYLSSACKAFAQCHVIASQPAAIVGRARLFFWYLTFSYCLNALTSICLLF